MAWYQHWDRHKNQCNRRDNSKINPHIYGQLISNKVPWHFDREGMVFSNKY